MRKYRKLTFLTLQIMVFMKKTLIPLIALFFAITLQAQPRIFVNNAATGANNGTTWEDAYTNLQQAIDDNSTTDIWVAKGTYLPNNGSMDANATFRINRPVNIIGSFIGTESTPDDRVIDANQTILSGDLAQNDVFGNNDLNRADNVLHIVVIESSAGNVTFDGLAFAGGSNSEINTNLDPFLYSGAAIHSSSKISINKCNFYGNIGGNGCAVHLGTDQTKGSIIQNSKFYKNKSFDRGPLHLEDTRDIQVNSCDFSDNITNRGSVHAFESSNIVLTNCNFSYNQSNAGNGAGIFSWQSKQLDIVDCSFTNNVSTNGSAIFINNQSTPFSNQDVDNILIQNCNFSDNIAGQKGAAIYAWKSSFEALACSFNRNKAAETGGAIYAGGSEKHALISNCTIEGNEAGNGAGMSFFDESTFVIIKNSTILKNNASTAGGGVLLGMGADGTFEDCLFASNTARWGGAMFVQDKKTIATIKNTTYLSNSSENFGGAISLTGEGNLTIENSKFERNTAKTGGAINIVEEGADLAQMNITNTIFNNNTANEEGGALNISSANTNIVSSLFTKNKAIDAGIGGAISTNATGNFDLFLNITNSTFADNEGSLAAGISTWTANNTAAQLQLLNNAFVNNLGPNYGIAAGNAVVQSLGGNFSSDQSTVNYFNNASDFNNDDRNPMFSNPSANDYHLMEGSPLIDTGIETGAPLTDLEGNSRTNQVDIGAFEFTQTVGTANLQQDNGAVLLTPNPANYMTTIAIENDWTGEIRMEVFDLNGKLILIEKLIKTHQKEDFVLYTNHLKSGSYVLILKNNQRAISKKLIKI